MGHFQNHEETRVTDDCSLFINRLIERCTEKQTFNCYKTNWTTAIQNIKLDLSSQNCMS